MKSDEIFQNYSCEKWQAFFITEKHVYSIECLIVIKKT